MATNDSAAEIAAKATGLRPDQIARAVEEYRAAAENLEQEPEWRAQMHMSGCASGLHTYIDPSEKTKIILQIETWTAHGKWQEERYYVFGEKPYELYAEARSVELEQTTKIKPHVVGR